MTIQEHMYRRFRKAGMTVEGACAVLGQIQHESGFKPTNAEDSECIASITWSSIEDEIPTGPGRLAIAVNGAAPAVLQVDQGIVQIDLAKYCSAGLNSCILTLTDIYSNKKTFAFSIMVTSISLSSSFDTSVPYTGKIPFPYTPVGSLPKTVHFILDGTEIGTQETSVTNNQVTYGWDPAVGPITGNTVYTATYIPHYTATFVTSADDGGQTLWSKKFAENTTPVYGGSTPTTTQGDSTEFEFIGWEPALGPISANTTYTAKFQDNRNIVIQFLARTLREYEG